MRLRIPRRLQEDPISEVSIFLPVDLRFGVPEDGQTTRLVSISVPSPRLLSKPQNADARNVQAHTSRSPQARGVTTRQHTFVFIRRKGVATKPDIMIIIRPDST